MKEAKVAHQIDASTIVSADSHVLEPVDLWERNLSGKFSHDRIPKVLTEHHGQKGRYLDTTAQVLKLDDDASEADEVNWDPVARIKFQDQAGVGAEIINPTYLMFILHSSDRELVRACVEIYNDWLADYCSADSNRLWGVGVVPIEDVDWAINQLHSIHAAGLRGVIVPILPPPDSEPYRAKKYDPFWAAAADLGIIVSLHSLTGHVPDPFFLYTQEERENSPTTILELNFEIMYPLATDFIFGGILDRHPDLTLLISEFEISWLPPFLFHLKQMEGALSDKLSLPRLDRPAAEYVTERMYHSVVNDLYALPTIEIIGSECVMWGSDFPHARSIGEGAPEYLTEMFKGIRSLEDLTAITGRNARRVFNVPN